jgi:uncharacterized protein YneF (UPF0154 family)
MLLYAIGIVVSFVFGLYTGWYIRHEELKDEIDRLNKRDV